MPGKVNPVIPEVVNQVAFEVIGNDVTVTMAAEAGQLQLNAFEPIIAASLFKSLTHLRNACLTLRRSLRARHHRQPRADAAHVGRESIGLCHRPQPRTSATSGRARWRRRPTRPAESVYSLVLDQGLAQRASSSMPSLTPEGLTAPRPRVPAHGSGPGGE